MSKRRKITWLILGLLPVLMAGYIWFMNHRPALADLSGQAAVRFLVQNSDLLLSFVILLLAVLPFYLSLDKKRAQARDLAPIAVMAAVGVTGRAAFAIVPLPNFKPMLAIIMMTAIVFGPESGYLTGALAALLSNFLFGQGPWTPWQMVSFGVIGFLTGVLYRTGVFGTVGQAATDEEGKRKKPVVLCIFGFFMGILYGWIMNIQYVSGYVRPVNLTTIGAAYAASLWYDVSHGLCTALVLWLAGEPWVRKLLRIRKKFGLDGESRT